MVRNGLYSAAALALAAVVGCGKPPTPVSDAGARRGDVGKAERPPEAPESDIWQNQYGEFWSNSRIPLLHGVPAEAQRTLPEHQRQLIAATEANLAFAEVEFRQVKNQFGLTQLREQLGKKNRDASDVVLKAIRVREPVRWVGQVRLESDRVSLLFGNSSSWVTHGRKYPHAKDKSAAFCSKPLTEFEVAVADAPPAVRSVLSSLTKGQWVDAEIKLDPGQYKWVEVQPHPDRPVDVLVPETYSPAHFYPDSVSAGDTRRINFSLPTGQNAARLVSIKAIK